MSDPTKMTEDEKCPECRGFGYTKGGPNGPWEKLSCDHCVGTGIRTTTDISGRVRDMRNFRDRLTKDKKD